jgi:Helix-turn-helix domain
MTLDESVHGMRLRVIERAQALGTVSAVCRELGISRTLFYRWRKRLERYGIDGVHPRRQRGTGLSPLSKRSPSAYRRQACGGPAQPPSTGRTSERTHDAAERTYETGQGKRKPQAPSRKRARAVSKALKREGHGAASKAELSRQAKRSARERRRTSRSPEAAAQRGAAPRMRVGIASEAARKAARTWKGRGLVVNAHW